MPIVWPSNTKAVIDEIRSVIGRDITFNYIAGTTNCSGCNLDPVTDTSDNSFCPICSGEYYIKTISGYEVPAVITWSPSDKTTWVSGGTYLDGDCIVQVELTDEILSVLAAALEVIVDGKTMEIKKKLLRGVKGLNRILISLIEREG